MTMFTFKNLTVCASIPDFSTDATDFEKKIRASRKIAFALGVHAIVFHLDTEVLQF